MLNVINHNIFSIALILLMVGCSNVEPEKVVDNSIILVDNIIIDKWSNDQFTLDSVYIVPDDILVMDVHYAGGCENHDFALIISTGFEKSNPVQTDVLLSHDNNDDSCEAYIGEKLQFNLTPLKDLYITRYGRPGSIALKSNHFENKILYSFN